MIQSRLGRVTVGDARDMQLPGTAIGLRPLHLLAITLVREKDLELT
jgi:hypothetical protein